MTIERASDNPFPSILMVEGDPEDLASNPTAGQRRLAVGADHLLYLVDDTGTKTAVGGTVADILDIPTAETDDTLVLAPDGAGGVEFRAETGGGGPGTQMDYVQRTSNASITATSAGTADTILTGNAVAYDGSTIVLIEFSSVFVQAGSGNDLTIGIFEGSTEIGRVSYQNVVGFVPVRGALRLTPSNATHTYLVKGWVSGGTATVGAGAGGAAAAPAYIRITKV